MTRMNVREMHKRLMLYKMVQEVVKKSKTIDLWEERSPASWLCNIYEGH